MHLIAPVPNALSMYLDLVTSGIVFSLIMPRDAVSRTANVERTGRHVFKCILKYISTQDVYLNKYSIFRRILYTLYNYTDVYLNMK